MKTAVLIGSVLFAFGCGKKDKPAGGGGEGGGAEANQVFGCAIAIAPVGAPVEAPTIAGEGKSPIEAEAHLLAEADACKKAGAEANCVTSGKYEKRSGSITRTKP